MIGGVCLGLAVTSSMTVLWLVLLGTMLPDRKRGGVARCANSVLESNVIPVGEIHVKCYSD